MSHAKRLYEEQRMSEIAEEEKKYKADWRLEELIQLEKQNKQLTENKNKPKN